MDDTQRAELKEVLVKFGLNIISDTRAEHYGYVYFTFTADNYLIYALLMHIQNTDISNQYLNVRLDDDKLVYELILSSSDVEILKLGILG